MNKEELYSVIGTVDEELLQRCEQPAKKTAKSKWLKWGAIAACLCFAAIFTVILMNPKGNEPIDLPPTTDADGVTIPQMEVTLSDDVAADMIGFFIYQGKVYTQYEWIYDDIDIVGEYLGTATGLIDEWTPADGYVELAGSVSGDFYSVKGYDPSFMLCMNDPSGAICTYVCSRGITVKYGSELYEERLHLRGNFSAVEYETRESWNWSKGELSSLDKDSVVIESYISELYSREFILWSTVPEKEGHTQSSIYDTETFHVYFRMNNGTTVHLRLYENGYVRFQGLPDVCVQVSADTYNSLIGLFS